MALVLPSSSITVLNGGLGVTTAGPTNVHLVMGPSSKGDFNKPLQFNSYTDAATYFGAGQMPRAAAYAARGGRARYVCVRLPAIAEDATISAVTKPVGKTVALSGTPTWGYDVVIKFVVGGTVGVAGATYKVSLNHGITYGAVTPLGTGTTIVVDGVTVTLTATETYSIGAEISYQTKPGSQKIGKVVTTRIGSSTSALTLSGAPIDDYELVFQVVTGGTIATAGISYRISLDGGYTYGPETALGTATSIDILDNGEPSGVTLALGAGTLDAGDVLTAMTTAPTVNVSDVQAALAKVKADHYSYRFVHVVGETTVTKAGNIASELTALEQKNIFTYGLVAARDFTDGEVGADKRPSAFYDTRLLSEFSTLATDRLSVWAGRARVLCPATGRQNRRPASWIAAARLVSRPAHHDLGRKRDGALPSDVNIYNKDGELVEVDSRVSDTLHGAKFGTLRTFDRQPGVFITRGNIMSGNASDIDRIPLRAVMDLGSEILQAVGEEQLENYVVTNPSAGVQPGQGDVPGQDAIPGAIREADARVIERELNSALENGLVAPGYVSAMRVSLDRTVDVLTSKSMAMDVELTPLGYIDSFKGRISFVNRKNA